VVQRIRKNPFARMFRCDKTALLGIQATLQHFINGDIVEKIPLYRMLSRDLPSLTADAEKLAAALDGIDGVAVSVEDDVAYIGSGSVPDQGIPSKVVRLASEEHGSKAITDALRLCIPSVFGRLQHEAVLLDVRTLQPGEIELLADSVRTALQALSS
ncbi:MAG: hypothetical protein GY704_06545, partial [Phycisphaeraceae bacterium]|nr:hypothetical protein [Phycisphaeraceae bacterium]